MLDPTSTAIGTWSGGRFMHFGEPLEDERLIELLRPDERLRTVITADAYGAGEADALLGRTLAARLVRTVIVAARLRPLVDSAVTYGSGQPFGVPAGSVGVGGEHGPDPAPGPHQRREPVVVLSSSAGRTGATIKAFRVR